MNIFFDLETLPCNDANVIAELEKTITAPATHKKQETIDKWMEENKASELKNLVAKTSFDGMYGRIACIAWAMDSGEIYSTAHDMSEEDAIRLFYFHIEEAALTDFVFCGHNIHGFDLPFLKHRSIVLGIKPPSKLLRAMNSKPWAECIADTMLMWSDDRQKRVSMEKLCRVMGIQGKGDFDGSMVAETWPVDPHKVIDYCKDDVARTRQIYQRLTFQTELKLLEVAA